MEALAAGLDFEIHHLSLGEGLEAIDLDRSEVDEDTLARLLFNEPVTLGVIEPFDLPSRHARCLLLDESDPHKRVAGQTALVCGTLYRATSAAFQTNPVP